MAGAAGGSLLSWLRIVVATLSRSIPACVCSVRSQEALCLAVFFMTPSYGNPPHRLPSRKTPVSKGFSSIDVDSPSGSTYMSVRPVDPKKTAC